MLTPEVLSFTRFTEGLPISAQAMARNLLIPLLISGRATVRYFVACLRLNEKAGSRR